MDRANIFLIAGLGLLLVAADPSPSADTAGPWYVDHEAGVGLPLPFADGRPKTAEQAWDLLQRYPSLRLPPAARLTSAVYAKSGLPFLVIWLLKTPVQGTLAEVIRLSSQATAADSLNNWEFKEEQLRAVATGAVAKEQLQAKILVQLVHEGAVVVAYYFTSPADADAFDVVAAGLRLTTAKPLTAAGTPRPMPLRIRIGFGAIAFLLVAGLGALVARRRGRPHAAR